jgi:hypothetical protein
MKRFIVLLAVLMLPLIQAQGQGLLTDILAGNLVNPEVGVFAWYELTDNSTQTKLFLRQAIVGTEKVKRKDGYWVETQIFPQAGFPATYKMLLTGPASDARNVHKIIVKEGTSRAEEVPVDTSGDETQEAVKAPKQSLGKVTLEISSGPIEAEHFVIEEPDGKTEVWVNESVRPMGIVRMLSPQGELMLQRFGVGGEDALSALEPRKPGADAEEDTSDYEVRVEETTTTRVRTNFGPKKDTQ